MSDLFNGNLHIFKGVQPCCRICGHNEDWEYPSTLSNKHIIKDLRRSGWHASSKGMICDSCWRKKKGGE